MHNINGFTGAIALTIFILILGYLNTLPEIVMAFYIMPALISYVAGVPVYLSLIIGTLIIGYILGLTTYSIVQIFR